ncbi:hypothetical protein, partial [Pseudomonas sp. H9]|uniref:hypothetical protein n=1 Tax=Pseudomonas sp. H9 TaxID=483968 RepID=UPI001057A9A2
MGQLTTFYLNDQTFDGLGRPLTITVGGRTTQFEYRPDQLPPCANILADGQRIDFTYEAALEHKVLGILAAGEPEHHFTYHKKLALTEMASGPLGSQQMRYSASGKPMSDTWTVDGQAHTTTWRHSLCGVLLGFVDAQGSDHQRHHDKSGRLEKL